MKKQNKFTIYFLRDSFFSPYPRADASTRRVTSGPANRLSEKRKWDV